MSNTLHIAVLTVGSILIAVAVAVTLIRMAGRQSLLAGAWPRLVMGLAGVALIVWSLLAARPGTAPPVARVARVAAPAQVAASGAGPSAPTPAVIPQAHADLILLAGAELDDCTPPKRPSDPADGATATRAQMVASDAQAQAFNTATNAYLACLDQAANNFNRQYGAVLNANGLKQVQAIHDRIYNAAVDLDHAMADKFNQQLRIYKARGGTS